MKTQLINRYFGKLDVRSMGEYYGVYYVQNRQDAGNLLLTVNDGDQLKECLEQDAGVFHALFDWASQIMTAFHESPQFVEQFEALAEQLENETEIEVSVLYFLTKLVESLYTESKNSVDVLNAIDFDENEDTTELDSLAYQFGDNATIAKLIDIMTGYATVEYAFDLPGLFQVEPIISE